MRKIILLILLLFTVNVFSQVAFNSTRQPTMICNLVDLTFYSDTKGTLGKSIIIDWDDGNIDTVNFTGDFEFVDYTYATNGYKQIRITGDKSDLLYYVVGGVGFGGLEYIDVAGFVNLYALDLRNNSLTVENVSDILIYFDENNVSTSEYKYLYLQNQTPPAVPNAAGQTAKTNLINKGWTVNTD